MSKRSDTPSLAPIDLVPSLREVVQMAGLNSKKLVVAVKAGGRKPIAIPDKHVICISDGDKMADWRVATLSELFRGERQPPADMDHYPEKYTPYFFFVEDQLLTICDAFGDRTDQEMEEVYSSLRRRPDGRSLGPTHDLLWQVMALLCGLHMLSAAEFEALVGALLGSARKWGLRPVSRSYVAYLRDTFADAHSRTRLSL